MFDFISTWLKKKFLTFGFITRIIEKTARKNLRRDYEYLILDEMPGDILEMQREFQKNEYDDEPTAITVVNTDSPNAQLHGCVFFSLRSIKNCCDDFGFLESIDIVREITLHECRHADQFEFLRSRGGSDLIERVSLSQKDVPYLENIFEVDAYHYQFTGEKTDFEIVFARYL